MFGDDDKNKKNCNSGPTTTTSLTFERAEQTFMTAATVGGDSGGGWHAFWSLKVAAIGFCVWTLEREERTEKRASVYIYIK